MDYPPKKGAAFSLDFPIYNTSGKLLSGATISSCQISKDGGAFTNTTNSPAGIGTSGVYSLALTSAEMSADRVSVRVIVTGSQDIFLNVSTVARQLVDLAYPTTSGRGLSVNVDGTLTISSDTMPELAQGQPPVSPTLKEAVMLLYMALRNNLLTTGTLLSICNDAGTVVAKASLTDDGVTFTRAKLVSGA